MPVRPAATALAAALVFAAPAAAFAQVYFTVRELLADQFGDSERVSFERVEPAATARARIERRLGRALPRTGYTFYVARSGGAVDGYALFDEQRGQHEMISFATFFNAAGEVTRVEVVAYREPYGDGVRAARFRKQFVGRSAKSGFRPDHDIDAVSGATISSRSLCMGVERASVLLAETLLSEHGSLAAR